LHDFVEKFALGCTAALKPGGSAQNESEFSVIFPRDFAISHPDVGMGFG
jgi:hypothetical protein